jgi:outer membrane protein assembly factor BamB
MKHVHHWIRNQLPQFFLIGIIGIGVLFVLTTTVVLSGYVENPPALPGWTHAPLFSHDDTGHGIKLSGGDILRSSAVIAEIDGNTSNGKEVAIGGNDGMLYVYGSEGGLRWSVQTYPTECAPTGQGRLASGPAVGEVFGNGVPYVVVGYGEMDTCDGGVALYDGRNGTLIWRFSLKAWVDSEGLPPENLYGVVSTPALADTDGDGIMEIGFGGWDRHIYLLNGNDGTVRWYYRAYDTTWSSPAFVNIDSDPQLEMVIGTDITANPVFEPPTYNGGYVLAFDTQARNPKQIGFREGYIWMQFFDQVIYSSPVIADVLPSNPGSEIIIGSGCYWPDNSSPKRGNWLKILRMSDGATLQTLNADVCVASSAAVGDIDDDGELEIVATVNGATEFGGNGYSHIVAWDPTTPTPKWTIAPTDPNTVSGDPYGGDLQSPVIADVDGNGSLEVLAAMGWAVVVVEGKTGTPLTCQNAQTCGNQTTLFTWDTMKATPAVGDINNDGVLEVVMGGGNFYNNGYGMLYAWTSLAGHIQSTPGSQPAYSAPWPMFRGNANRTGVHTTPRILASSEQLRSLVSPERSRTHTLTFANGDGTSLDWSIVEDDPHNLLTPSRTSGTSSDPLAVTVSVPADGLVGPGTYQAILTVSAGDLTPVDVVFSVQVVEKIETLYLPLVKRGG